MPFQPAQSILLQAISLLRPYNTPASDLRACRTSKLMLILILFQCLRITAEPASRSNLETVLRFRNGGADPLPGRETLLSALVIDV
jgi:hypothetical protein